MRVWVGSDEVRGQTAYDHGGRSVPAMSGSTDVLWSAP
jgi:hypothetical protein